MGCWWMFFSCCVLFAVLLLLYYVLLLFTAVVVVQGSWVDRFMGLSTGSWVTYFWEFFSSRCTGPALAEFSAPLLLVNK